MKNIQKKNYNSKVLVEMWTDFIDWKKRRKGENGFLLKQLKKHRCQKVFDACCGDGADSVHLLKNKLDVTSNDIDKLFIKKARENAKRNRVQLTVTSYDWRRLDKHFKPNSFDAILCLGNSLTYLFKKTDRLKTLYNFRRILQFGGVLIIDERNYQYMLDEQEEILKKHKFNYSGKFVYCGDKVHGAPVEISDKKVRMEYTDEQTTKRGYLVLCPFKRRELLNLLQESDFTKIEQYSDYKKGFRKTADFYQYVCIK
jgi:SAM-dependent methyltransferase